MPHKVGNGAILGIVSEDGVPAQKRITLIDRSNLSIIRRAQSDEYGAYAFTGLNPDTDDYLLFTVDDDGVEKKAAIIYDYVKPIPAHQGGFYWANWYRLSMAKEPICSFLGNTASGDIVSPELTFGVGRQKVVVIGGNPEFNKQPITPASKSIATLGLVGTSIGRYALNHKSMMTQGGSTEVSAEWVLDTSTVVGSARIILTRSEQKYEATPSVYDYTYPSSFITIAFDKTSNKVSVYRQSGVNSGQNDNPTGSTVMVAEYTLPTELQSKPVHLAASIAYGESCELYVNGALVASANLGGTPSTAYYFGRHYYVYAIMGSSVFSSQSSSANPASFQSNAFAFYSEAMSANEALEHYEALFVDSIPLVTGYLKAVIIDYPLYLFRLDTEDESLISLDALRYKNKRYNNSALIKAKKTSMTFQGGGSIVNGGSGIYFNGGAVYGTSQWSFPNSPRYASVEFIAKPSVGVISGYQVIVSHRLGATILFEVRLNSDRKLVIAWMESGVATTVLFNTVISSSDMAHYAVSVDKEKGFAYLFVNGATVETIIVTKVFFDNAAVANTTTTESIHIGGIADSTTSVSLPYIGYLSEVAAYPYTLTERMVKAHYDARLTL